MEREFSHPLVDDAGDAPGYAPQAREARAEFAEAVLAGLGQKPRSLPCRFLYDARGSELFEQITALPEYYPTRTETALLETYGEEIAEAAGDARALIEFGSGSSRKTNLLLDALSRIELYVPIDVSGDFLADAARRLARRREGLAVKPLVADFTKPCTLPGAARGLPKLGFFSGSTIGNLGRAEARSFLQSAAGLLGAGSTFLVGVDLKKDPSILIPAYDDGQGVTAEFNLNLLARINRELDGQIDVTQFAHRAIYNGVLGRMEMYLESLARQTATVLGRKFHFGKGERIHTENSHKYSVAEFQALARGSGWEPLQVWTDQDQLFSLHLLRFA